MSVRIAVLGLGEAGSAIARDLVDTGAHVRGYDPKLAPPAGVVGWADEADAVRDADIVLSVNSSHDAMTALTNALPALLPDVLWADLNTSSPGLKTGTRVGSADVNVVWAVPGHRLVRVDGVVVDPVPLGVPGQVQDVVDLLEEQRLVLQRADPRSREPSADFFHTRSFNRGRTEDLGQLGDQARGRQRTINTRHVEDQRRIQAGRPDPCPGPKARLRCIRRR